jgi:cell division cycle 14
MAKVARPLITLAAPPNVYLAQNIDPLDYKDCYVFGGAELNYVGYCDDFGPMNASSVIEFMDSLKSKMDSNPSKKIIYCAEPGRRNLTNAAFLLGSYAILISKETPEQVWARFNALPANAFESYRDATFSEPCFGLSLLDCWSGLARGISLGWIDARKPGSFLWGRIDNEEYDHYDNPLNGDLHIVVPGKFIAFRGPVDLPGGKEYCDHDNFREFSPKYYAQVFRELGVTAVVRLNERHYDGAVFEAAGIRHVDIPFEDCTAPPDAIVAAFLRAVDAAPGLVAVHCKAGLGRTGTLIALHLMRSHGFTARAAMGWLRIMRPGSVIGEQQDYLCAVEREIAAALAAAAASRCGVLPPLGGETARAAPPARRMVRQASEDSATLARQVADAARRRAATIIQART